MARITRGALRLSRSRVELSRASLVGEFHPDLALLDIGLPVMDGFDLAQRLKRRLSARPPKFVAITGYGQPSDRARSKQAGFDEHLVKPVDLARLNAIVRSVGRRADNTPGT